MDIKKALQFIEVHADWYTKDATKQIVSELSGHLNSLTDSFAEKDKEIERLQAKLKNQCSECPLNRRFDDSEYPAFLRRQAD